MKKILAVLLMLFGIGQVSALEYSDYSEFSEYTENYLQSNDLTDVKVERRYKYYKLEKELGGYGENNSSDFPYIDKDDYIYTDYSKITLDRPEDKEGRIIEEVNGYQYKKIKNINYLKLVASMADLTLENIKVIYKNKELDYDIETKNVVGSTIKQNGYIKLKFNEMLDISKITLTYEGKEKSNKDGLLFIKIGNNDTEYGYTSFLFASNQLKTWTGINMPGYQDAYEDYYSEIELEEGMSVKKISEMTLYKYKDILYRNYNLIRIYYDEYRTMPYNEYVYRDDSLYKDYYSKRVRTILPKIDEANRDIIINDEKFNDSDNSGIKNMVLDKTDNVYKIPSKSIYYPLDINKIDDLKKTNTKELYLFFIPIVLLVILILVLSKLYQKKKECVKV